MVKRKDFGMWSRSSGVRAWLLLIIAIGLAFRLAMLVTPRAYAPDEIYQYLEPAYRLVFGHGIVTWEYRYNVRSWLVPIAITGPMALGHWIAPGSALYLLLPKASLIAASLTTIGAAAAIGWRASPAHGLFAAFVVAVWYEFIYFSSQMLTDGMAVMAFLAAAAILHQDRPGRRHIVIAGILIGFAVLVRFQYGPAIALFALLRCRSEGHSLVALAAGVAISLAIQALVDTAMGQTPFVWLYENFHQNIVQQRSHLWTDGPGFYPAEMAAAWSVWLVPLLILAAIGARRYPALMAVVIVHILFHTLIAHKEYRYILLSTMVLVLLAAIGTVDAVAMARKIDAGVRRRLLLVAGAGWVIASATIASSTRLSYWWVAETPQLQAFADLGRDPGLCGLAIQDVDWSVTGGYSYLHRDVPMYLYDGLKTPDGDVADTAALMRESAGFNAILALNKGGSPVPAGYRRTQCYASTTGFRTGVCVYRRAGSCDPKVAAEHEFNRTLVRRDR